MAKSPICFLQEFAIKQGYFPIYDFMTKNVGNNNQFFCKVTCKDLNATGIGNSKKEAKQRAAENMLLLLGQTSKVSMPSTVSSLPIEANKIQNTQDSLSAVLDIEKDTNKNVKEISNSCTNYIGMLQELCIQQKLSYTDILYRIVEENGPSHIRCFTIEVSVGSLRAQGTANSKKIAKQEAAKNLLQNLGLNKLSEINKNVPTETIEENMRKLGIISENVINKPTLSIMEQSDKAQSIYLEYTDKVNKSNKLSKHSINNLHILFEDAYLTKIPHYMKKKMQAICIDETNLIQEMRQYIENILKLKIQQFDICKLEMSYVVGLRLSFTHNITQIGIAKTKHEAATIAMYNIITAISILLN